MAACLFRAEVPLFLREISVSERTDERPPRVRDMENETTTTREERDNARNETSPSSNETGEGSNETRSRQSDRAGPGTEPSPSRSSVTNRVE